MPCFLKRRSALLISATTWLWPFHFWIMSINVETSTVNPWTLNWFFHSIPGSNAADTLKDHCNKTVDVYGDVSSPEVTSQNRGQPLTCWYRFRSFRGAPRDWVLRLKFNKFKVGNLLNATHCEGGYLQVSRTETGIYYRAIHWYYFLIPVIWRGN